MAKTNHVNPTMEKKKVLDYLMGAEFCSLVAKFELLEQFL